MARRWSPSSSARASPTSSGSPATRPCTRSTRFYDEASIRFVTTRHEQGTTYLADGYARASGRPGVAFVVPGVGIYNAGAGLATAFASSSPVVLIAGQVNRAGIGKHLGLLHEIDDQLDLVRPVTEWQRRALEASEIADTVHEAFVHVQRGRRQPVEIEMPPEAFSESAEITLCAPAERVRLAADPDEIARAADVLVGAERPVVWAGGGVVLGDATAELAELAEFLQARGGHHSSGEGRLRRPPSARTPAPCG